MMTTLQTKSKYFYGVTIDMTFVGKRFGKLHIVNEPGGKTYVGIISDTKPTEDEFENVTAQIIEHFKLLKINEQDMSVFCWVQPIDQQNIA